MGNFINLAGRRFGRLVARTPAASRHKSGGVKWVCTCDCGQMTKPVMGQNLLNGDTQSCGCLRKEVSRALATARAEVLRKGRIARDAEVRILAAQGYTAAQVSTILVRPLSTVYHSLERLKAAGAMAEDVNA